MDDEKAALDEVVNGFPKGNTEHYRVIRSRITQYVHKRYYGDAINKDDIVSDVVEILLRNLKDGKFYGDNLRSLEAYIFGIVKNAVLGRRDKSGRLLFRAMIPEPIANPSLPIDDVVAREDLSRKILAALDEKCRELLELKFRKFWSDKEIADHYGKTKNATSTAISRCLKKARELDFVGRLL